MGRLAYLLGDEGQRGLWAMLAALTTLAAAAALAAPAAPHPARPSTLAARALLVEVNAVRAEHSLRPVRLAPQLSAAAGQHSQEMGERGYFQHASFDGTSFWKRVGRYYGSRGYRYWSVGENLLWSTGTLTPAAAVTMWMKSPPHRRNLLNRHWRQIGLAVRQFPAAPGVFRGLPVTIVTSDFGLRY
jgi:uncharacterized protein YkwD